MITSVNISVTPEALARRPGYQIRKTRIKAATAIMLEQAKCIAEAFIRCLNERIMVKYFKQGTLASVYRKGIIVVLLYNMCSTIIYSKKKELKISSFLLLLANTYDLQLAGANLPNKVAPAGAPALPRAKHCQTIEPVGIVPATRAALLARGTKTNCSRPATSTRVV